ncbi:hypothetical protein GCM10009639_67580 [Kitasatospora putterlickiae]|uniref:Uncharacterized protein n=1 Tax=Kitasatospora putterlickiae TaxID=221725 RepID=A0ABP4J9K4_9ACTN
MRNEGTDAGQKDFTRELREFAADLRTLRIERGQPSYGKISKRAPAGRPLSVSALSSVMTGEYLPSLDFLMALVRTLLAFDAEQPRPLTRDHPQLLEWRSRWAKLKTLQDQSRSPSPLRFGADDSTADTTATKRRLAIEESPSSHKNTEHPGGQQAGLRAGASHDGPEEIARLQRILASQGLSARMLLSALEQGERIHLDPLPNHINGNSTGVAFSPDGRVLATTGEDGMVRLWDPATRKPIGTLIGHSGECFCPAFSPDGRVLATTGEDGMVRLWDPAAHRPIGTLTGHPDGTIRGSISVAFSPDGQVLATTGEDGAVRLWDPATHAPVGTLTGNNSWVAFSSDGRFLAATSTDGAVRLWDPATHEPVGTLTGHVGRSNMLAFSPDGRVLATTGDDGMVRLWDPITHEPVGTLTGHPNETLCVAFSPDGRVLATTGEDGAVRLWNLATREPVDILAGDNIVVAFSPDGRLLATTGEDGTLQLWITPSIRT